MQNDNPYKGVNAHLNSKLQNEGLWTDFHNTYIVTLRNFLVAQLPDAYLVDLEQSLQIRRVFEGLNLYRPDVLIMDVEAVHRKPITQNRLTETTLAIADLVEEESADDDYYPSIVIKRRGDGSPIVWLEMLSSANKPKGSAYDSYYNKRWDVLQTGITFVEIDFLHQQPPTFPRLPDYTRGDDGSHPYRVLLLDPMPNYWQGKVVLKEFDVDTPIPVLQVPLSDDDTILIDFEQVYQRVFTDAKYGKRLDYSQVPTAFNTYSATDQERIRQVMARIRE
jgi:hypothetical protein